MQRYGNLYNKITDIQNLRLAHNNAQKGKRHYKEVQKVNSDPEAYLNRLQWDLVCGRFRTSEYKHMTIYDSGKVREISKLPYYPDRIVHHAIMNVLAPIWDKTFIYDCYSAIPGKGIHAGITRLKGFLKDRESTKYCLKFDISKYYPNINHSILLEEIKRTIKCKDTLSLLEEIIRSPGGHVGIPIGNYLSQYFANIYLNRFDHWLKEDIKVKYYIRYCDDGVILASNKPFLHHVREEMERKLGKEFGLRLNSKTQIFPVDSRGIDFLGYRTWRHYSLLRKDSAKRLKRKIRDIGKGEIVDSQHIVSSVMSYLGWLQHCNSFNLRYRYIHHNPSLILAFDQACKQLNIHKLIYIGE